MWKYIIIVLIIIKDGQQEEVFPSIKPSIGVFLRSPVHTPIIYTQITKLLFSYEITWLPRSDTSEDYVTKFCAQPANNKSILLCEVFQHLIEIGRDNEETLKRIYMKLTGQPYPLEKNDNVVGRRRRQVAIAGAIVGYAVSKFTNLFNGDSNVQDILQKVTSGLKVLQDGVIKESTLIPALEKKVNNNMKTIIDKLNNFIGNNKIQIEDLFNSDIKIVMEILKITQRFQQFLDLYQQTQIMTDCRSNRIPILMVEPNLLNLHLNKLESELQKTGFVLAIPSHDLSEYYLHKHSECEIQRTSNGTNIIHLAIDVPIRKREHDYKLHNVISIPFLYQNTQCKLKHAYHTLVTEGTEVYMIDNNMPFHCDFSSVTCYFNPYVELANNELLCLKLLIKGATIDQLIRQCEYECSDHHGPTVIEVESHYYAIIFNEGELTLKCENQTQILHPLKEIASLYLVQLHCGCVVAHEQRIVVESPLLCRENMKQRIEVHKLIPIHLTNLPNSTKLKLQELKASLLSTDTYGNVSEIMQWKNLTIDETFKSINLSIPEWNLHSHFYKFHGLYSDAMTTLWCALLTIMVMYLMVKLNCQGSLPFLYTMMNRPTTVHALDHDEIAHRHVLFLIIMACLNCLFLWLAILVTCFYLRRKWKRDANAVGCEFHRGGRAIEMPYLPVRQQQQSQRPSQSSPAPAYTARPTSTHTTPLMYPNLDNV